MNFPEKNIPLRVLEEMICWNQFCLGDICFLEVVEKIFCTGIPPVWR